MASYPQLAPASTDPRDKHLVIRELVPGMLIFSQPFTRLGLAFGGRSTAIKVNDGIFVYVSHPYTTATAEALKQLGGEVKWLVTPDGEHDINIKAWTEQFPDAQAIGVDRVATKKPDIKWAGVYGAGGEDKTYGFEPEISLHPVSAHVNHELTAIHHPSGTLLEADLLFNLPPKEQYSRFGGMPLLGRLVGSSFSPSGFLHKSALGTLIPKAKSELAKKEMAPIFAAKWDRVVPCHGDVIDTGGKAAFSAVYGSLNTESKL